MSPTPGPAPIVVGVDGSPSSDLAVDWGTQEASHRNLPLRLLNAWTVDFSAELIGSLLPEIERQSQEILTAAAARARAIAPDVRVTPYAKQVGPASALVQASLTADTVVLGRRGVGTVGRMLTGSTSMQVAAHAHCPVVVVRDGGPEPGTRRHVVVGVDGSGLSSDAVAYAVDHAALWETDVTVVHAWDIGLVEGTLALNAPIEVWEGFEDRRVRMTAEAVAGWAEKYPDVAIHTKVVHGDAADALLQASDEAALLVVGGRGHGGFLGLLLGSVSRTVLHLATCPVAVVRPAVDQRTP